ncbi:MAG: thioredoxin-dependent thiol peroxidase [Bacteroidales bacterium]|nr:thioredoxin-dependent thiol peroxidase [Bacteroidales bacterium]
MLHTGDKFPDVLGLDEAGREVRVSDYAGRTLVVYFYPKDSTSGCTAEACSFRDHYATLREQGVEVVGVSVDSAASHQRFIDKQQLPFHLVADVDKQLVQAAGVWGEKKLYGRTYMGTLRTTFVIGPDGSIRRVFLPKEIKTKTHAEQVMAALLAAEQD